MADQGKTIGILGGTFDPVHLGHLGLARDVQKQLGLDAIWFIPAWRSPHKQDQTPADPAHRMNMLKKALAPYPEFQISEIELDRRDISYTIDTLKKLHRDHPEKEWTLILGMDTFRDFVSWKNAGDILRNTNLAVATRPGFPEDLIPATLQTLAADLGLNYQMAPAGGGIQTCLCPESDKKIIFCEIHPADISSRQIREALRQGKTPKKMLPPEVEEYIMEHLLYQANPQPQPE